MPRTFKYTIMSHHSEHDSHDDNSVNFMPLKDNNHNLSLGKIWPLMLLIAVLIFGLVPGIKYAGGFVQNEQQEEWKVKHERGFKDSDENLFYKSEATAKEEGKVEEKKAEGAHSEEAKPETTTPETAKPEEAKPEAPAHK